MARRLNEAARGLLSELPQVGRAGSRSAQLHDDASTAAAARATISDRRTFFALRWAGTVGTLLIALGGLGAGALPVVGNPYENVPLGSLMSRMLQTSSALVFVGVALLVVAWVAMAPHVGTPLRGEPRRNLVSVGLMWRTYIGWVLPLLFTAPLFTQDIYSYLANGSIVAHGLDPYSAGPVELLGPANVLARSVPFIWANSPSPYGPVALGLAALISKITGDSIMLGVFSHRIISLTGVVVAGWAMTRLAHRCRVSPEAALWLGVLNPLAILHLIGGIHNESVLLGLILVGMELGLGGIGKLGAHGQRWLWQFIASGALISCAGMVKVTGFIALGFTGMALARTLLMRRGYSTYRAVLSAVGLQLAVLAASVALVTLVTGIDLGWIAGQGGAATVRSWLSMSTAIGVASGFAGMMLGLGDHTDAILSVTRTVGVLLAGVFMTRMLLATLRGAINPVGGLGVSTLVLVILFPVVHPWYILWAVLPLAAWANRQLFRLSVVGYSAMMSFVVLPRGLGLPVGTVVIIYVTFIAAFAVVAGIWWVALRRSGARILN